MVGGHGVALGVQVRHVGLAVGVPREALAPAVQHAEVVVVGVVLHHQHDDVLDLRQQVGPGGQRRLGALSGLQRAGVAGPAFQFNPLELLGERALVPLPPGAPALPAPVQRFGHGQQTAQVKPTQTRTPDDGVI